MTATTTTSYHPTLDLAIRALEVALPAAAQGMEQDEEWIVAKTARGWQKIRLHDYADVYEVPGLYEKWVYELLECRSPQRVADLLLPAVAEDGLEAEDLSVLDLGAGNGYVADVLSARGVEHFVGVDIFEQAAEAAERDRPGLYSDYVVGDLTNLPCGQAAILAQNSFNCLTCVAALGFGDIPPEVFAAAFNQIEPHGWAAFTIKKDFVGDDDRSGFACLIKRMVEHGVMEKRVQKPFVHRVSTDGEELIYQAFIGRKRRDIPDAWIDGS